MFLLRVLRERGTLKRDHHDRQERHRWQSGKSILQLRRQHLLPTLVGVLAQEGEQISFVRAVGQSWTVSESSLPAGYNFTDITCSGSPPQAVIDNPTRTVTITPTAAGQQFTCIQQCRDSTGSQPGYLEDHDGRGWWSVQFQHRTVDRHSERNDGL